MRRTIGHDEPHGRMIVAGGLARRHGGVADSDPGRRSPGAAVRRAWVGAAAWAAHGPASAAPSASRPTISWSRATRHGEVAGKDSLTESGACNNDTVTAGAW